MFMDKYDQHQVDLLLKEGDRQGMYCSETLMRMLRASGSNPKGTGCVSWKA